MQARSRRMQYSKCRLCSSVPCTAAPTDAGQQAYGVSGAAHHRPGTHASVSCMPCAACSMQQDSMGMCMGCDHPHRSLCRTLDAMMLSTGLGRRRDLRMLGCDIPNGTACRPSASCSAQDSSIITATPVIESGKLSTHEQAASQRKLQTSPIQQPAARLCHAACCEHATSRQQLTRMHYALWC